MAKRTTPPPTTPCTSCPACAFGCPSCAVVVGLLPEFDGLAALGATTILRLFAIAYVAFAP